MVPSNDVQILYNKCDKLPTLQYKISHLFYNYKILNDFTQKTVIIEQQSTLVAVSRSQIMWNVLVQYKIMSTVLVQYKIMSTVFVQHVIMSTVLVQYEIMSTVLVQHVIMSTVLVQHEIMSTVLVQYETSN